MQQTSIFVMMTMSVMLLCYFVEFASADAFTCNDLCFKAKDGVCDDGAKGSSSNICPYASDCSDCGVRPPYTRRPTPKRVPTEQPTRGNVPPSSGTDRVTKRPTLRPTRRPGSASTPTKKKTSNGRTTKKPSRSPTFQPSISPTTSSPTISPSTSAPSISPSVSPSHSPSAAPTTLALRCTLMKTIEECCGPVQTLVSGCKHVGCKWVVLRKKSGKCVLG